MLCKVILVGRITSDLELKKTSNSEYVRFSLAVEEYSNGKTNVDFIKCVTWGHTASNLCKYMRKGSMLAIDGKLTTSNYQKNGVNIYTMQVLAQSIQYLSSPGSLKKKEGNGDYNTSNYNNKNNESTNNEPGLFDDDDLPFR